MPGPSVGPKLFRNEKKTFLDLTKKDVTKNMTEVILIHKVFYNATGK